MKKVLQQPSASLDRLLQHSRYLEFLSKRVLTYLPAEFAGKISVLGFSNKNKSQKEKQLALIIATISPAWASKLRFYTPVLKRSLTAEPQFNQLKKIVIRVNSASTSIKKDEQNPVYSQNSATIIHNSAEHIENEELKEALTRLAYNVEKGR